MARKLGIGVHDKKIQDFDEIEQQQIKLHEDMEE